MKEQLVFKEFLRILRGEVGGHDLFSEEPYDEVTILDHLHISLPQEDVENDHDTQDEQEAQPIILARKRKAILARKRKAILSLAQGTTLIRKAEQKSSLEKFAARFRTAIGLTGVDDWKAKLLECLLSDRLEGTSTC